MREIEIKLKATDLESVVQKLKNRGCVLSAPIRQHDTIYAPKANASPDFWLASKEGDVIMRIRRMDGKAEFNLKQQRSNEMDNLEYETVVADPEAMHQILGKLGWVPEVEVKKMRRKGKLEGYEICLDQVEELGSFVELEKLTDDNADPQKVREELFQTLESLGLSRTDEETRGYDTQVYQLHHKH
jgi:adenylate cyclase, class 2